MAEVLVFKVTAIIATPVSMWYFEVIINPFIASTVISVISVTVISIAPFGFRCQLWSQCGARYSRVQTARLSMIVGLPLIDGKYKKDGPKFGTWILHKTNYQVDDNVYRLVSTQRVRQLVSVQGGLQIHGSANLSLLFWMRQLALWIQPAAPSCRSSTTVWDLFLLQSPTNRYLHH